jgi:hypothetical protein
MKVIAQNNEIEVKGTTQSINETECWFFEKINKISKSLVKLKKERKYINY